MKKNIFILILVGVIVYLYRLLRQEQNKDSETLLG